MKALTMVAVAILILHGFVHLMGTIVYMRLGTIQNLPYKTTLLGTRWDLGAGGISAFGALWSIAALGFVVAALAFGFGWAHWQKILLSVTLFSLVLTALDWNLAFAGVILNLIILVLLWSGLSLSRWIPQ